MSKDMKLIMERWDKFVVEEAIGDKIKQGLANASSTIAAGFGKMDDFMQQDYCEKKYPAELKGKEDIETWGDLLALLKCGVEYKGRKEVLNILASFVPGVSAAKDALEKANDISTAILRMYQVDDDARPSGNMGKLDMDDNVSQMIDDKIEKQFIIDLIKLIQNQGNLEQQIPDNWNITAALQTFLTDKNKGRTVTGFDAD